MFKKELKKGYQIAAMAMTVVLAVGCFVGCASTKEGTTTVTSNTETYNKYIKDTLIPQYGLADLSNIKANITIDESYGVENSDIKINLNGIVSAYVDDMDGDKTEDLVVVRFKEDGTDGTSGKKFSLAIGAYTIKNEKVEMLDEVFPGLTEVEYSAHINEIELNETDIKLSAVSDGESKYLMLEYFTLPPVGDGIFEYFTAYKLADNKLVAAYSFEPTVASSAPYVNYNGYVDGQKEMMYNSGFEDVENKGKYASYEEALPGFWNEHGIKTNFGVEESIVDSQSLINKIFTYEWKVTEEDTTKKAIVGEQIANDYTNVAKVSK